MDAELRGLVQQPPEVIDRKDRAEREVEAIMDPLPDTPVELALNLDLAEQNLRDDPLIVRGNAHVESAEKQVVTTNEDAMAAATLLAILTAAIKRSDDAMERWSRQPQRGLTKVRALINQVVAPLVTAKDRLAERLVTWRQSEQVLATESAALEARRLQDARAARAEGRSPPGPPVEVYPQMPPTTFDTPHGQVTIAGRWTHRVLAPADLPDEFWCPDERAIADAVRRGVRIIPGVDIYQKDHVSVRVAEEVDADGP